MSFQWTRSIGLAIATTTACLLTACGSSTVESALEPDRIIVFGDASADIGQSGRRFTVGDTKEETPNWSERVAKNYNLELKPAKDGGDSYAEGNARISKESNLGSSAKSLKQQIDDFLSKNEKIGDDNLFLISFGTDEIIAFIKECQESPTDTEKNICLESLKDKREGKGKLREHGLVGLEAKELAEQVKRLIGKGANHIVVVGVYNLSHSIWAKEVIKDTDLLGDLSTNFNLALKFHGHELLDQTHRYGQKILYVDQESYVNEFFVYRENDKDIYPSPSRTDFPIRDKYACKLPDENIDKLLGKGSNAEFKCNLNTLVDQDKLSEYFFADGVYLTPRASSAFGGFVTDRIRNRW